jgi:hypothetical protein
MLDVRRGRRTAEGGDLEMDIAGVRVASSLALSALNRMK